MQDLRLVLIIMGAVAIAALLLHGLWASKREQPSKFKDNPIKKLDKESVRDADGFDKDGIGKVTVVKANTHSPDETQADKVHKEPDLGVDFSAPSDEDIPSMSAVGKDQENLTSLYDDVDLSISIEQAELKANFEKQKEAAIRVKEQTSRNEDTDIGEKEEVKEISVPSASDESENMAEQAEKEDDGLVIVLHVHASQGESFPGNKLFNSMEQNGLRFGEMSIYHRYADLLDDKKVLFSVANSLNPGTFDHNEVDFSTPSISFFMTLPCYGEAEQNFKLMLQTAQKIAGDLGGTVQDQERRMITPQKINEYRAQVRNFQ